VETKKTKPGDDQRNERNICFLGKVLEKPKRRKKRGKAPIRIIFLGKFRLFPHFNSFQTG
jgi:hypothetical protein